MSALPMLLEWVLAQLAVLMPAGADPYYYILLTFKCLGLRQWTCDPTSTLCTFSFILIAAA